ncbi:MAG: Lrp/AsnC family transcriptional regulator [Gammaproteobacteria bacterium]|nr:Lrp/AsnC family transcriptional regulator [Gammaproteobacteria bacterium]
MYRRIKRMESEGIIRGRVAVIDPEKIGLNVTVFVRIKIREHSADWTTVFLPKVAGIYVTGRTRARRLDGAKAKPAPLG